MSLNGDFNYESNEENTMFNIYYRNGYSRGHDYLLWFIDSGGIHRSLYRPKFLRIKGAQ